MPEPTFGNDKVKGRAFGSPLARGFYTRASTAEVDPRAKPGALTRDVNTRLSTAETDPRPKTGAPAAAPAAVESKPGVLYGVVKKPAPREFALNSAAMEGK